MKHESFRIAVDGDGNITALNDVTCTVEEARAAIAALEAEGFTVVYDTTPLPLFNGNH